MNYKKHKELRRSSYIIIIYK